MPESGIVCLVKCHSLYREAPYFAFFSPLLMEGLGVAPSPLWWGWGWHLLPMVGLGVALSLRISGLKDESGYNGTPVRSF